MNSAVRALIVCSAGSPDPPLPPADFAVQCTVVSACDQLRPAWSRGLPDVVVVCADADPEAGWNRLEEVRQLAPSTPTLLLAPASSSELVFRAGQAGVDRLLPTPVDARQLGQQILALARGRTEPLAAAAPGDAMDSLLLGHSPEINRVRRTLAQVADADVTVLLRGESGTGKEVAARCLWSHSRRADAAFIKVNCAAIPHDLLESELFGYEAGAFTGAVRQKAGKFDLAHHGTIFLDEISELHPLLQAKLLHVLQDGEFCRLGGRQSLNADVRIVAATNVDLEEAVAQGRFRQDLYYRLNVVSIVLPTLRARPGDIPLLLEFFLARSAELYGRPMRRFHPEALERLERYCWPGNVRELENLAKRLVILGDERQILADLETIPVRLGIAGPAAVAAAHPAEWMEPETIRPSPRLAGEISLLEIGRQAAQHAETEAILQVLQQTRWNRRQAARILHVSYKALQNKLKSIKLADPDLAAPAADPLLLPQ